MKAFVKTRGDNKAHRRSIRAATRGGNRAAAKAALRKED